MCWPIKDLFCKRKTFCVTNIICLTIVCLLGFFRLSCHSTEFTIMQHTFNGTSTCLARNVPDFLGFLNKFYLRS